MQVRQISTRALVLIWGGANAGGTPQTHGSSIYREAEHAAAEQGDAFVLDNNVSMKASLGAAHVLEARMKPPPTSYEKPEHSSVVRRRRVALFSLEEHESAWPRLMRRKRCRRAALQVQCQNLTPTATMRWHRVALFSLEEYESAKASFEAAHALNARRETATWIRKCDAELQGARLQQWHDACIQALCCLSLTHMSLTRAATLMVPC